jgi:hypothetical protein
LHDLLPFYPPTVVLRKIYSTAVNGVDGLIGIQVTLASFYFVGNPLRTGVLFVALTTRFLVAMPSSGAEILLTVSFRTFAQEGFVSRCGRL